MIAQVRNTVKQQRLIEQLLDIKLIPLESAAYYCLKGKLYPCTVYAYSITIEGSEIGVEYGIEIPKQNIPDCYYNNESFHEFVSVKSVVISA